MNHLSNDQEIVELRNWLGHHYAARVTQIQPLAFGDKRVYHIEQAGGADWIVRLYALPNEEGYPPPIAPLADLLLFLEQQEYPAERVMRPAGGGAIIPYKHAQALVTSYLGASLRTWQPPSAQGKVTLSALDDAPPATAEIFFRLGKVLGRLHSLPADAETMLRPAGMLPEKELKWVSGYLAEIGGRVPSEFQREYEHLMAALDNMSRCAHLPVVLIHNDCNLGNVVLTSTGETVLIDWEMAGLGPPVVDVGILLRNCFSKDQRCIDEDAIRAVVAGYRQHRGLNDDELACLPDAIGFMTLVLLAGFFPDRIEQKIQDSDLLYGATYAAWHAQFEATEQIAALARACFHAAG